MRFLGGKSRLGGQIVQAMLHDLGVRRVALAGELCGGAGNVTCRLADVSDHVVSVELHPGLVAMHQALQAGWLPPEEVSEAEYLSVRASNAPDPRHAFLGFGCSFGGLRTGFAKTPGRNYCAESRRAVLRDVRPNVTHVQGNGLAWQPPAGLSLVYADPPYDGTQGYDGADDEGRPLVAPPGAWWLRLQALARLGVPAFLSEYRADPWPGVSARQVWQAGTHKHGLNAGRDCERLWRVLP